MQASAAGSSLATWVAPAWFTRLRESVLPAVDPAGEAWSADRVELTHVAFGSAEDDPNARILELRRQIAAGTYLTVDKLEATVSRLHRVLRSELVTG